MSNDETQRALDHYKRVYRERADAYHELVMAEDCDGNLSPAIAKARGDAGLAGIDVLEIGVGTGRVTGLLAMAGVRSILGTDQAPAMLAVARAHLDRLCARHSLACQVQLLESDFADGLPAPDDSADLVLAGWVFGHMTEWFGDSWTDRLDSVLAHCDRVTRPGGTQVIIETLGSGAREPSAPTPELSAFYRRLEERHGFRRQAIATDYRFPSVDRAVEVCGAFFGEDFAALVRREGWARVPEWTGLWSRQLAA